MQLHSCSQTRKIQHVKKWFNFGVDSDSQIGYKVNHETAGGSSLVSAAARINNQYQGRGLFDVFDRECLKQSLHKRPWIKAISYASIMTNYTQKAIDTQSDAGKSVNIIFVSNYIMSLCDHAASILSVYSLSMI